MPVQKMTLPSKICTTCNVEKQISEFHAQKAGKYGVTSRCKECQSEYARHNYLNNKDKIDAQQAAYVEKNKDLVRARQRARYAAYIDEERERSKNYYYSNIEKERARSSGEPKKSRRREIYASDPKKYNDRCKQFRANNPEICKRITKEWQLKNLHRFREYNARRRSKEMRATPKWADRYTMTKIYEEAIKTTKKTGIRYVVDHIVPINSPIVCGLHCEANLEVKTLIENCSKGNRYWPDMP